MTHARISLGVLGYAFISLSTANAQVSVVDRHHEILVHSEYGNFSVTEPVFLEIIRSSAFERLKHIHQYGVTVYRDKNYSHKGVSFSRYDHSLGVFVLLRRFGASLEEQVAGLLHDISHTVFSHVGDMVFGTYFARSSYQDDTLEAYLECVGIMDILKKYKLETCCSAAEKKKQKMLEQDKPDLCIDRIDYLLRGALADGLVTEKQIREIIDSLCFEYPEWSFKNVTSARTIGMISLWFSEHVFGSAWNAYVYRHAAKALKRGVECKLITKDDIRFSQDDTIWEKLCVADDQCIKQELDKVIHYQNYYSLADEFCYDEHIKVKCFAVNPWIKTESGLQRLTALDAEYANAYTYVNALAKRGWYIKFKASDDKKNSFDTTARGLNAAP